jgi:hypothetical protein
MNRTARRVMIAAPAAIVVFLAVYSAGRGGARKEAAAPARTADSAAPAPRPVTALPAAVPQDFFESAPDRSPELNALQERLTAGLAAGTISGRDLVELFRSEADPAALDVIQGVLAVHPEAADEPGVVEAFVAIARADSLKARRQAAVAFLGNAWDKDGTVREALFAVARADSDVELRLPAIAALRDYATKNVAETVVRSGLLELAARDGDGEMRAQALSAVDLGSADARVVQELAGFLSDPSPSARLAAAERLGESPAETRGVAVAALEEALGREPEPGIKQLLLAGLARAGALEPLRRAAARDAGIRPDAEEFVALLERGLDDWSRILEEKSRLESARSASR